MTLTKINIIDAVAENNDYSRKKASETVETILDIIKSTLASGEDVPLSSFSKFCVNEKNERKGRNPATGKDMMIDARRVVTFKCSGKLRDKMNSK